MAVSKSKIDKLKKCINLIDLLLLLKHLKRKRKCSRRWWVRPHLAVHMRNNYGALNTIFKYFCLSDHEEFYTFMKMNFNDFISLHELVGARLQKNSRRPSFPSVLRLAAVLWLVIIIIQLLQFIDALSKIHLIILI